MPMQMNIYVPKDKENLVDALERAAADSGRPKNELVLEALERYLRAAKRPVELARVSLGQTTPAPRRELYEGRLER